jgi:hypothetical protein
MCPRAFEHDGLNPRWATAAQFVAPLAILMPLALVRPVRGTPTGVAQLRSGLLIDATVTLHLERAAPAAAQTKAS